MAKKQKYEDLANRVVTLIGGKDNISFFTHCVTRLRFNVKDKGLVNVEEIERLEGVVGCQWSGEQLQIIIGAAVNDVYQQICDMNDLKQETEINENIDEKKKWSINTIFEVLSACIVPIIPALCGTGIIKGLLIIGTNYGWLSTDAGIYVLLNAVSDATFYFLPFLISVSAAKKFKTNGTLAMILAGLYLHPSISALSGQQLNLFGIDINIINYSSTVLPIIISVWIMSYVYKFIDSWMPKTLRVVFTPALTVLIMSPICLGVIGPLGYNIGLYLGQGIKALYDISPLIAGFVNGALRPLIIATGMQTVFTPIMLNNLATLGYDFISPVHTVATMATAGMCFGAFLRMKKSSEKENYLSAFVSAFIGITEPALYGIALRIKRQLIALMIGGGVSGAFVAFMGAKMYAVGMPSWVSLPGFGDTIPTVVIGLLIAFVVTAAVSFVLGFDKKEGK